MSLISDIKAISFDASKSTRSKTGIYKAGDTLVFNVKLSQSVEVSGVPRLAFMMGAELVWAEYSSALTGTNKTDLKFIYVVRENDADANGVSVAAGTANTSAIDLNGGTIHVTKTKVAATLNLNPALADVPGAKVDTLAPTITASYSVDENTATDKARKSIDLNATEPVTWSGLSGTDAAAFTLGTGKNAGKLLFKGLTDFETKSSYSVSVTGSDAAGNKTTQNLTIHVTDQNDVPVVATPLVKQLFAQDLANSYKVPSNAFKDVDAGATLTYSATLANGKALPAWLSFNASNRTFTGTPPAKTAPITVRVKATDEHGAFVYSNNFTITPTTKPIVQSLTVTDGDGNTIGKDADKLTLTLKLSQAVTSNKDLTAVFILGGKEVKVTHAAVAIATDTLIFEATVLQGAEGLVSLKSLVADSKGTIKNATSGALAAQAPSAIADNTYEIDALPPIFPDGSSKSVSVAENTTTTTVVLDANATDHGKATDVGITYTKSGADADQFTLDAATGQLKFAASPDFEAPQDADHNNSYQVSLIATDAAGNNSVLAVTINVSDVAVPTTAQAFALWQEAETAWTEQQTTGSTTHDINALNAYSSEIVQLRDATSADGSANQADATKRLSQYINQVTGTDIVSHAEYQAGFTITGHATVGAQATIKFRLDKDRTDGVDGQDAQVLNMGANDVNNDGTTDVTVAYDNATGDWSLAFAAGSGALLQATHNTWGSGVHQLLVDTDGNGSRTGTGTMAEASRLFLVADGTAKSSDTGLVRQNYSVQDKITDDVFVYYYGDPDGVGIGLWTALDNGDSASNVGLVTTNKDGNTFYSSDQDCYNTTAANTNAATTPVTASNTALHFVTEISAQAWEFHMATNPNRENWDAANAQATDHTGFGSNSSRQASLAEAIALYATNFESNTVGAMQPMSNAGNTNAYNAAEDNQPGGWGYGLWVAAPTPSGHALLSLFSGNVFDFQDAHYLTCVSAVL